MLAGVWRPTTTAWRRPAAWTSCKALAGQRRVKVLVVAQAHRRLSQRAVSYAAVPGVAPKVVQIGRPAAHVDDVHAASCSAGTSAGAGVKRAAGDNLAGRAQLVARQAETPAAGARCGSNRTAQSCLHAQVGVFLQPRRHGVQVALRSCRRRRTRPTPAPTDWADFQLVAPAVVQRSRTLA